MNTNQILKQTANGINYFVTKNDKTYRTYGIGAEMQNDSSDKAYAENLFFTEAEADACCKWLADNEVYPITLCEVLKNLYVL